MSGIVYAWKPKTNIKIDPQLAGETVEMLRERLGGTVTPTDLLQHARASNSPLHEAFEWDDAAAAEQHRLEQAGQILRFLVVTVLVGPRSEPKPMRAFVNVVHREQRGYTSLTHAMSDADLRAQVVDQAWKELLAWREKYQEYKELASVMAAIAASVGTRKAG